MAMRIKINKTLVLIFILALFLRFIKLDSFPVSLSWDEVAIGYNAYSIAQKGVDEYGTAYPLLFRSFDDYKLPGYIYTDAIFIKLFGFSDTIVRLPSALFGALLTLIVYFLFKKLFGQKVGIISSFLISISPWSLQFSRGAFEANLGLFVTVSGITLLLYGFKNRFVAFISIPVLFSSLYFYYSQRLIVPLIFIAFFVVFRKRVKPNIKQYLLGFLIGSIILLPIIFQILGPNGFKRVNEVSIISDQSVSLDYLLAREKNNDSFYGFLINRRIPYFTTIAHNYFQHFSPGFIFFGDDPNPRHRSYLHGLFYVLEIPLIIIGLFLLWKSKKKEEKMFIIFWIIVAPLTSALSTEAPHGLRSLLLMPPLILLVSLAVEKAINTSKKTAFILFFLYGLFFVNYAISYYLVYPISSVSWGYGYKQMYEKVFAIEKNFDRIIITGNYWKPRIYYQYYRKSLSDKIGQDENFETINKYYFAPTFWDGGKFWGTKEIGNISSDKALVVLSQKEFESFGKNSNLTKIGEIKDYSGRKVIFVIAEWNLTKNKEMD
ncbi:MAG: glycosyltransferase family 39 protein [Candidatus Levybacteria bacterium]|nr:glycosyltransferase family 39 protein [Candidatus Levybacteria bacterium]